MKCNLNTLTCTGTKDWNESTNFISTQAFYPYGNGLAPQFIINLFNRVFGDPCQILEYGGKCLTLQKDSTQPTLFECEKTLSNYQCWTWNLKNVEYQKSLNWLGDGECIT